MEHANKIPVVIMAGGLGSRIRPVNSFVPKPLIPINNKPILQWGIESLVIQGYGNIILTISHMADKIQAYFGDGKKFGCTINYYIEKKPLGNAGALFKLLSEGWLGCDTDFLLLNADLLFDIDLDRFYEFHKSHDALVSLFVHPNNHPYDSGLVVMDREDKAVDWLTKEDKRPEYYSNCVNAGIHIIKTSLLLSLVNNGKVDVDKIGTEVDGKTVKVDLDRQILKPNCKVNGRVYAYTSPEYVKDMGTPERFEQVSNDLKSGLVHRKNLCNPQRAIFLDRDGTINKYIGFLRNPEALELLPGVTDAIRLINASGYLAIIVTNQPVIARGEVTTIQLQQIHNKLETLLGFAGAYIDGIYICPHHPDRGFEGEISELKIDCDCRKPKPGLILKAAKDFNIDLNASWMIGDSWRDIECGRVAGCKTILLNGDGTEAGTGAYKECCFDTMAVNLYEAVQKILLD